MGLWPPLPGHFGPPWPPKTMAPSAPPRGPQVFQSEGAMAPPAPPVARPLEPDEVALGLGVLIWLWESASSILPSRVQSIPIND